MVSLLKFIVFLVVLMVALSYFEQPSLERDWALDQAVLTNAVIDGDEVTLTNVRNFTYRAVDDYTPAYYDTTLKLSDLRSVDFIVEPFGSIGAAHTFLSFGFAGGEQIAISIEIRKEKGESFSPWLGLLRQYELMYVIADERDVVELRTTYRKDTVYLYPTTASPEQARNLFVSMLNRAESLTKQPEFYNTLFSNCTTNIVKHINEISQQPIGWDYRLLFPEDSDVLAKQLGFIAPDLSIEEARIKYRINERAEAAVGQTDFSAAIRVLPATSTQSEILLNYEVNQIIDGDTIEVKDALGKIERVRYIGMDTPELNYETGTPECLAIEARERNSALVAGQSVQLIKDVRDTDKYGRLLRYVVVDGIDVGQQLLLDGYAKTLTIPPDIDRASDYKEAETKARMANKGLWGQVCQV